MDRQWTDERDGTTWDIEAIPMMARQEPGRPTAMIGETDFHLWFRSGNGRHVFQLVIDPDTGSRLGQLADDDLAALLDRARSVGIRIEKEQG